MVGCELNSIPRTVSMVWVRVALRDVPLRLHEGCLERLPNLCWNDPNSVVSNLSITIFISFDLSPIMSLSFFMCDTSRLPAVDDSVG